MLVFTKKKVVRRKVTIQVPNDGEGFTPCVIFVTWEILPNDDKRSTSYDGDFFKSIISNLEDLVDEEKKPITFTKEFLADFVTVSYVLAGLQREYLNCTVAAGRGN